MRKTQLGGVEVRPIGGVAVAAMHDVDLVDPAMRGRCLSEHQSAQFVIAAYISNSTIPWWFWQSISSSVGGPQIGASYAVSAYLLLAMTIRLGLPDWVSFGGFDQLNHSSKSPSSDCLVRA